MDLYFWPRFSAVLVCVELVLCWFVLSCGSVRLDCRKRGHGSQPVEAWPNVVNAQFLSDDHQPTFEDKLGGFFFFPFLFFSSLLSELPFFLATLSSTMLFAPGF